MSTWLNDEDFADLFRFDETCEDSQPYDIPKERMKRLAELGVVCSEGFGRYSITSFGQHVLKKEFFQEVDLPLKTHADYEAISRDKFRAQISAGDKT